MPSSFSMSGCFYWMEDEPSVVVSEGQSMVMVLRLEGQIVDVCNNDHIVEKRMASLQISGGYSGTGPKAPKIEDLK